MTSQTNEPTSRVPWRKRAGYKVGKTRKQRQEQYRTQMNFLIGAVVFTLIAAGIFTYLNWRGAGSTKAASCADFPEFCVPFAGGGSSSLLAKNEAPGVRELDEKSTAVDTVVRGYTADNRPFIGNPNAPVHIRVVPDFSCPHCRDYHEADLNRYVKDYVLTGKATLEFNFLTGVGGIYSQTATEAAFCAGEQGAFWEMTGELYRLQGAYGAQEGFNRSRIAKSARDMGLDGDKLLRCVNSNRYSGLLDEYQTFANDMGVEGTPTVFVSYGTTGQWTKVDNPAYTNLKSLTDSANGG